MLSDCFTLMDEQFRYWTGKGWHKDEKRALVIPAPVDGYERISELAAFHRNRGHRCMPCYWPPVSRHVRKSTSSRVGKNAS